jgi:hypothetical protein
MQPSLGQTFTLANATHEALLQSGNIAYMHLYTSHIIMQTKYEALQYGIYSISHLLVSTDAKIELCTIVC